MNDNYLMHYGVLGMKWGIRRYQNADGTRTALGKKRQREERAADSKPNYKISKHYVRQNADHMTNKELQDALTRLDLQKKVKDLDPSLIDKGQDRLKKYVAIAGTISGALIAYRRLNRLLSDSTAEK